MVSDQSVYTSAVSCIEGVLPRLEELRKHRKANDLVLPHKEREA
jgi:hypothetical protein